MDKTAIKEIIERAEPHIIEINGRRYTDKDLSVIEEPRVITIKVSTLSSLVKLLKIEQTWYNTPIVVHVVSPDVVRVHSGINFADKNRETPYIAEAELAHFYFGEWYSYEKMMIALKSKFVETLELNKIVKLLGTITEENNMKIEDDGFTQTVTVKKGIALKDNKAINPRVRLIPFSTFTEVKQPEREFLLRLDGYGKVALFEADGGAWKSEARKNIADYLEDEFKDKKDIFVVR